MPTRVAHQNRSGTGKNNNNTKQKSLSFILLVRGGRGTTTVVHDTDGRQYDKLNFKC